MRRSWSLDAGAPALAGATAAAMGIALGVALDVPPPPVLAAAFVACSAAALVAGLRTSSRLRGVGALGLILAAGFQGGRDRLLLPARDDARIVASLPDDNVVTVVGRIDAPWSASGSMRRADVDLVSVETAGRRLPLHGPVSLVVGGTVDPLEVAGPGDLVRVVGTLRLPEGVAGGRTPFALPMAPRIRAKSAAQMERLAGPAGILAPIDRLHRATTLRLKSNLKEGSPNQIRALALLMALVMGETADLPPATTSAFRDGGVAHVLAISGLQIALLAVALHILLSAFPLRLWQRDTAVLGATLLFSAFAGGGAPVLRAALMISLYLGARLVGRPTSPWQVMGLSALVLLLSHPANLFDIGFLLTYAAVAGLAAFGPPVAAGLGAAGLRWHLVRDALGATVGAEAAVFPIQAFVFHVVPFVGLVSNLVVVPLSNVYLFAGIALSPFLLLSPAAARLAILPLELGANGLLALLDGLDRLHAFRFVPTPPFWLVFAIGGLLVVGALVRPKALARTLFVLAAGGAAIVAVRPSRLAPQGTAIFQALDVGQGDAWLLLTPEGRVLVDGGGSYDTAYDFGRLRLLPKLADQAAVAFDAVVLTHPHPDHSRGLVAVIGLMPVKALYVSRGAPRNEFLDELLEVARRRGVPIRRTGAGEQIRAAGLELDVLHPGPDPYPRSVENNSSLVLRFTLGSRRVLLTGDIEHLAEEDLVASAVPLSADLLKVCHHGSRTSTTATFLQAVSPRTGVIGVGRHNSFGHPSAQVLERLQAAKVRVFRTDVDGDIAFRFEHGRMLPLFPTVVAGSRG